MDDFILCADSITKTYGEGAAAVLALNQVSLEVPRGQFLSVMGPSGSGKSTLLHVLAGLDRLSSGEISLNGVRISHMGDKELTLLRRNNLGFVFQAFNLLPMFDAKQNILLPLELANQKADMNWFNELVSLLGLKERLTHRPSELSGGQQQRVAIARALMTKPAIIFADEPTGNLDSKASEEVLKLFRYLVDHMKQSIVMVTHDPHAAAFADRTIILADGCIVSDLKQASQVQLHQELLHLAEEQGGQHAR